MRLFDGYLRITEFIRYGQAKKPGAMTPGSVMPE